MTITMGKFVYLILMNLLLTLSLMARQGCADNGTVPFPEGPPWHFWFNIQNWTSIKKGNEVFKLKFNQSNTQISVNKMGPYRLKYVVTVDGRQTPNEIKTPAEPNNIGIILDKSSIGIWMDQRNAETGEFLAMSPINAVRIVQLDSEHDAQYSGKITHMNKSIDDIFMKKCFSPPISATSTSSQVIVTCPTHDISPTDKIIPNTNLPESQNEVTTVITDMPALQTSDNKSNQFTEEVPGVIQFQPTVKSDELVNEVECSIPGYIWALLGLTSILAFLFIPLLVYAIRISRRYHKVCIKLESWKNQGDSKLPPYLDMRQNTLRRPQPIQTHQMADVNSICSNITPPQTPLSATESALSSHLFDTNSSTLPRGGGLIRTASVSSYTNSGVRTIDSNSNSGYSSLKRQNSTNSYTNPTITNAAMFSAPPPPPLDEMEEEDHSKHVVETAQENNIFVM